MNVSLYRNEDTSSASHPTGEPDLKVGRRFRTLVLVTVCALFILVTVGGIVRTTNSGLGCPDWPLCYSTVLPLNEEHHTYIELSHRVAAGVVGFMVAGVAFLAWRNYRSSHWILVPSLLAFFLLLVQASLGGITVLSELPRWSVMTHLAMAQVMVAVFILIYVASGYNWIRRSQMTHYPGLRIFTSLAIVSTISAFALIMLGSYVANTAGATYICGDSWPLCRGEAIQTDQLSLIHMGHRAASLIVGLFLAATLWASWRLRVTQPVLLTIAGVVGLLYLGQVVAGASNMWFSFPVGVRVLHLSLATALWIGLVSMVFYSVSDKISYPGGRQS